MLDRELLNIHFQKDESSSMFSIWLLVPAGVVNMGKRHVVVLVLGDLGRSPRMQYHGCSLSLLNKTSSGQMKHPADYHVSLIGYEGEQTISILNDDPLLSMHRLPVWDLPSLRAIAILHAVAKGLALFLTVLHKLWSLPKFQLIIIQNPPCLPALVAAIIISWFSGCKIMLDWHNLGFAMFEERLGNQHVLVKGAKFLERFLASFATHHICVSRAMKEWLAEHFAVRATVLYDRPPGIFQKGAVSVGDRHQLLLRLGFTESALFPCDNCDSVASGVRCRAGTTTIQTVEIEGEVVGEGQEQRGGATGTVAAVALRPVRDRVGLVMSCTSWTPDEDFTILLRALQVLEHELAVLGAAGPASTTARPAGGFRRLAVVVTGKGPMKAAFEASVAALTAQGLLGRYVAVRTAWLAPGDYPALLRCADLGVSLHTSTSGLDLPMKVLDMFGSSVPVCAFRFPSLAELVHEHRNGLSFRDSDELAEQLLRLLVRPDPEFRSDIDTAAEAAATGALDDCALRELQHLKAGASQISCWEDNWNSVMLPVVDKIFEQNL